MKELFLPYELAVIAKEKNYKGECCAFYNEMHDQIKVGTVLFPLEGGNWDNWNKEIHLVSAPLYQQIVDWFKKEYGILIRETFNDSWDVFRGIVILTKENNINDAIAQAFKLIS